MTVDQLESSSAGRPDAIPGNPLRALVSPYTWLATIHLLSGIWIAIPGFLFGMLFLTLWWPLLLPFFYPGVFVCLG